MHLFGKNLDEEVALVAEIGVNHEGDARPVTSHTRSMTLPHPVLANVAIEINSATKAFYLALADVLKERHGSRIHLYVENEATLRRFKALNRDGRWDSISNRNVMWAALHDTDLDAGAVVERAREFEQRIGEPLNRLAMAHRHFGRGFSPGSYYYPRSPAFEAADHIRMLHCYTELLAFWDREIADKGLTLILDSRKEAACMARARNVQFRRLHVARYRNFWFWTPNEYLFNPAVEQAWQETNEWDPVDIDEAYLLSVSKDAMFLRRQSLAGVAAYTGRILINSLYRKVRGIRDSKNFYLADQLALPWREWAAFKRMTGPRVLRLADLGDRPFVFYALHKEPEMALQWMSPEYVGQQTAIISVARDLPAGVPLVVKENLWSLGRRPPQFYDQLWALKNVVFLDVREKGLDVVRRAAAVVSITGTTGFEAAILGKPVITFGRHNMYSILPHVFTVTDEAELKGYLQRALNGGVDLAKAREDGARFLAAVKRCSFDMGEMGFVGRKNQTIERDALEVAYRGLLESFDTPDRNTVLKAAH